MEISIECKFLQYSFSECFCWTNNNLSIGRTNAANSFRIIGGGLIYMLIAVRDVELVEIRVSLSLSDHLIKKQVLKSGIP